jgi:hypothetical protein
VHAYIRGILRDEDVAEDLAQDFFTKKILDGPLVRRYDPAHAPNGFRPYLKQAMRNAVLDHHRRVRPETSLGDEGNGIPDASLQLAEDAFHKEWIRGLLDETLARINSICVRNGKALHFELFVRRYLDPSGDVPSWEGLAQEFGLKDGKTARHRAETVSRQFGKVLLDVVVNDTGSEELAMNELQALLQSL